MQISLPAFPSGKRRERAILGAVQRDLQEGSLRIRLAAGTSADAVGVWWYRAVLFYWGVRMTALPIGNDALSRGVNFLYVLLPKIESDPQNLSLWSMETRNSHFRKRFKPPKI